MKISTAPNSSQLTRSQGPKPPSTNGPEPGEHSLDSFFAADAALVVAGLGILAAPALAGATLGMAGVAAAAAGGAVLDYVLPAQSADGSDSKLASTITLAALAGTGAVLGAPAVLATAGLLGACGLMLSWVDTYHG
ncbi:MAG: hypothetical protein U0931_28910 [Vulcanimicrobiota bacterium]